MENKDQFGNLNKSMIEDYIAVNPIKNPVAIKLNELKTNELKYIISQYSSFPKHIILFLKATRDKARKESLTEIDKELTRNIGEELGTETDAITHYGLLVKGLREELETDVSKFNINNATKNFIEKMNKEMTNNNTFHAIGAIYACESSAVPELRIVLKLVNQLSQIQFKKEINGNSNLKDFFDRHLNIWEPNHESKLKDACLKYIKNEEQIKEFESGFRSVMKIMDEWWTLLSKESDQFI